MGIKSITTNVAGQIGDEPRRVMILTTDNLAAVTTAGYLNRKNLLGYTIYPTDIIDMWYSYASPASPGTFSMFTASVSNSGIITLTLWENPGNVALPVTGGDFANFDGTTGQIQDLGYFPSNAAKTVVVMANAAVTANALAVFADIAGTIKNASTTATIGFGITAATGSFTATAGNLIAGNAAGGNNALMQLFPTTATTGSLRWIAAANGGNFNVDFTNASFGQATVFTWADPGAATAKPLISGAAIVSGNLPQYSGTAGLTIDSGIAASGLQILSASISLNQAAVQAAYATPFQIIAAVSNKIIVPVQATVYTNFQTAAFANGGVAILQYDSTAHGAGTNALAATIPSAEITAASSQIYSLEGAIATALTGITNKGLYFSNQTQAFTAGNAASTVVVTVSYYLITATV